MNETKPHFNPFPGLRPFEAHENHLFFGREGQSDELLARLRRHRFLAVVGTSGSGKSSLVRAGMLPALHGGLMRKAGSHWRIAVFRPGNAPIANLAHALNDAEIFAAQRSEAQVEQRFTETTLRRGKMGLIEAIEEARLPEREKVLLVIDQFEELFRFKQSVGSIEGENEASAFVKLFLTATQRDGLPIYVVLTMRSDYLGDCAQFRDLPEAINDSQYLIPRMTRDQRRQAITGPIAVGGARVAARLVNRLLNDVGDNPDQLPILQHALMRTWDYWARHHHANEPIDLPHYEAIGTMTSALSLHADEAYNELLSPRSRVIAEKLFKALTEKGEDNREIRRPTSLAEASALANANDEEVVHVIEAFRKPGRTFLMPPSETTLRSNTLIDISHESLIRNWQRLKTWVEEEAKSAQTYRRLAETAMLHQAGQAGLWRDPDLQIALQWQKENRPNEIWAQRYHSEYARALSFLNKSEAARDAEIAEKEAIRQRELQQAQALAEEQRKRAEEQALAASRLRRRNAVLTFVGLIAAAAAVLAFILYGRAEFQKTEAQRAQAHALREQMKADSARIAERNARLAEEKARAAEEVARKEAERLAQIAEERRLRAVALQRRAEELRMRADSLRGIATWEANRADSLRVVAERLRRLSTALLLATQSSLVPNDTLAVLIARSAYYLNLNNGGPREQNEIYSALRNALMRPKFEPAGGPLVSRRHQDWSESVAFSPDGEWVASGSADSSVVLWQLEQGQAGISTLYHHDASVSSVAFAPNGALLASGSGDHTVHLWQRERKTTLQIYREGRERIWSVAFSPNSEWLAAGDASGAVVLWNVKTNAAITHSGHQGSVRSVAFSPDGKMLASGSNDRTVRLWQVESANGEAPLVLNNESRVLALAFSNDGRTLATGGDDNLIRLWDMTTLAAEPKKLRGHAGSINALAFSPQGNVLASASADRTARIWHLAQHEEGAEIQLLHDEWVWAVAFSPDGKRLATACSDKSIQVWVSNSATLVDISLKYVKRELTAREWQQVVGEEIPYEREQIRKR
jgi:WD40 repeat protein